MFSRAYRRPNMNASASRLDRTNDMPDEPDGTAPVGSVPRTHMFKVSSPASASSLRDGTSPSTPGTTLSPERTDGHGRTFASMFHANESRLTPSTVIGCGLYGTQTSPSAATRCNA